MANENRDAAARQPQDAVATVDYANLPDLSEARPEPLEMSGEYWTPEREGESKRLFYIGLAEESVLDMETGDNRPLLVVRFAENSGGTLRAIRNGSRRLVGIFEQFQSTIRPGDAFEITYLGKRKNQNNQFKSDNWSVKRLLIGR